MRLNGRKFACLQKGHNLPGGGFPHKLGAGEFGPSIRIARLTKSYSQSTEIERAPGVGALICVKSFLQLCSASVMCRI